MSFGEVTNRVNEEDLKWHKKLSIKIPAYLTTLKRWSVKWKAGNEMRMNDA
jgi:hypothetical protein